MKNILLIGVGNFGFHIAQELGKLKVEVPQEVADLLSKDTYRLRLTLRSAIDLQDKFVYTLFDDDDGLLIVR